MEASENNLPEETPEPRPGRTPPAILPPLEFTPPPGELLAPEEKPPHRHHKLPPPPERNPKSPSALVRYTGLIVIPPLVGGICGILSISILFHILMGVRRGIDGKLEESLGKVAYPFFWICFVAGALVSAMVWLRFTNPDDPADPPKPGDPSDPPVA